jgi:hypothetical protein
MYDEAFTVLNGLIEENDQVPDTLYLFGWANYITAEEVDESSPTADEERQEQLENAREALNACVKVPFVHLLDLFVVLCEFCPLALTLILPFITSSFCLIALARDRVHRSAFAAAYPGALGDHHSGFGTRNRAGGNRGRRD